MTVLSSFKAAGTSLENFELVLLGTNLKKDLRSAHLPITAEQYLLYHPDKFRCVHCILFRVLCLCPDHRV